MKGQSKKKKKKENDVAIDSSNIEKQIVVIEEEIAKLTAMKERLVEVLSLSDGKAIAAALGGRRRGRPRKSAAARPAGKRAPRGQMLADIQKVLKSGPKKVSAITATLLSMAMYAGRPKQSVYTAIFNTLNEKPGFVKGADKTWRLKAGGAAKRKASKKRKKKGKKRTKTAKRKTGKKAGKKTVGKKRAKKRAKKKAARRTKKK